MALTNPITWFEIYVQDMPRAKAFYQTILSVALIPMADPTDSNLEMLGFPSAMEEYGASGALVKMAGMPSGCGGTLVYFRCDDCAAAARRVAENGGKVFKEKMSIGQYGYIALVYDTEGNMIGLHSGECR